MTSMNSAAKVNREHSARGERDRKLAIKKSVVVIQALETPKALDIYLAPR
jgi:hypothetical protein